MNKLFQQILEPYKPLSGSKEIRQSRGTSEGGESPTCYDFKNRHEETVPAQNTFPGPALVEPPSSPCKSGNGETSGNDGLPREGAENCDRTGEGSSMADSLRRGNTYANCPYKRVPRQGNVYCMVEDCAVNKGTGTCLWENTLSGGTRSGEETVCQSKSKIEENQADNASTAPLFQDCLRHVPEEGVRNTLSGGGGLQHHKGLSSAPEQSHQWPSIAEQEAYWVRKEQ
jgi:hypothetical protein